MQEHRNKILKLLAEGKVSVTEAEILLNSISETTSAPLYEEEKNKKIPQFFHILVRSENEKETRIKIKVPLKLLKSGIKFANLIPEKSWTKVQNALNQGGVDFNLQDLCTENMDELLQALYDLDISVNDKDSNESVRIFCE